MRWEEAGNRALASGKMAEDGSWMSCWTDPSDRMVVGYVISPLWLIGGMNLGGFKPIDSNL